MCFHQFHPIVHKFDESSSAADCDLTKDVSLSYFDVFLCKDILHMVASETNDYHKMSVEALKRELKKGKGSDSSVYSLCK